MKKCSRCGFEGDPALFRKTKNHCNPCANRYTREWKANNKERNDTYQQKYHVEYYKKNKDKIRNRQKENWEYISSVQGVYRSQRRANDPLYKLAGDLRCRIIVSLRGRGYTKRSRTTELLGADFATVQAHLIATAVRRYGKYFPKRKYHIDHIIPNSSAKTEDELIRLQHYTNLQFLTPKDNLTKGSKMPHELSEDLQ
jgi:hypothetical protein